MTVARSRMRATITLMTTATTTRFLGNCQLCEGDFKLDGNGMVHHGYKRPGDGTIHGDCPGVCRKPYELSCDDIKAVKPGYEHALADARTYLVRLESGLVTRVASEDRRGTVTEYIAGVSEFHVWTRALESKIWDVKYRIKDHERTIARFAERIAAWTLRPIRTVEEEVAKERAAKEERARGIAEKRAVKAAKVAATKMKQEALKVRRIAQHAELAAKFVALATAGDTTGGAVLLAELHRPKYHWVELWDLPKLCGDALIALNLFKKRKSDGHLIPASWQD